jgi:flavin-dependent dehydrogenase
MYDAIVIGARSAGSPTAMLLARKGHKVLLVDRAAFPSDIPHGHFIHRHGPRRLQEWGLLQRLVDTNCPPMTSVNMDYGDFPLDAHGLISDDGVAVAYGPRREVIDLVLADAAREAGAEFRDQLTVEELLFEDGRVTGIRARTRLGLSVTERASVVIGADGRRSRVAQAVNAPMYEAVPTLTCWYMAYFSGVEGAAAEMHNRPATRSVVFGFPTNDGLFAVFVAFGAEQLPDVRADLQARFMAAVDQAPALAERIRAGRREGPIAGATDLPNFLRKPYGPGWALVGDAGAHKDPFLALGMCDAFRDAELLADRLHRHFAEAVPFDEALSGYERQRNEATMMDYKQNIHLASFQPAPDDLLRIRAAIRGNPEASRQFYMAFEGMIPHSCFDWRRERGEVGPHDVARPASINVPALAP